jgi:hypothetical protein
VAGYVFVSYSRRDARYVDRLVAFLRDEGVDVWVDHELHHGDNWLNIVREKVDNCAALVVVMTPHAEESDWVRREITRAQGERKPIMPLLLRGKPFMQINEIQYESVDGGGMPSDRFVGNLTAVAGIGEPPPGNSLVGRIFGVASVPQPPRPTAVDSDVDPAGGLGPYPYGAPYGLADPYSVVYGAPYGGTVPYSPADPYGAQYGGTVPYGPAVPYGVVYGAPYGPAVPYGVVYGAPYGGTVPYAPADPYGVVYGAPYGAADPYDPRYDASDPYGPPNDGAANPYGEEPAQPEPPARRVDWLDE